MTERKPILVIFHGDCMDGFTAAWAAWRVFGDKAEYQPATYKPTDVFDVDGREVYILDYCPSREALLDYKSRASSLQVIDHHKSAKDICEGLDFCLFDMNRSGAGMAWDFFHPDIPRPALVDYVEDRDIWRWTMPNSRIVCSAIFSYPLGDFASWDRLDDMVHCRMDDVLEIGEALERAESVAVTGCKKDMMRVRFLGFEDVPLVNASGTNLSRLLNELAPANYFAVSWHQRANGTFKYSLRSKDDFNVAKLGELFGGGGHERAAAFVSPLPPWELKEKPTPKSA